MLKATVAESTTDCLLDLVDEVAREAEPLRMIVPSDPAKGSVHYNPKKRPSEYVVAAYRLCIERQMTPTSNEQAKEGGQFHTCVLIHNYP
jgi:hypothetical protein